MSELTPQSSQQLRLNRALILFVASLGGFLVSFMASAVNIALPLIGDEFKVSAVMLGWISLSYILVATALLLPAGRLADLYGRMRLFLWGMIIFSVMSFASAFAPNAVVLLVFRSLHGVGLALGATTSVAMVVLAYPPESRGKALGLNVAGIYLGSTLGPVLGGLIVHNLGWRSLFLIVGALGFVNLVFCVWKLRHIEWREPKTARFDVFGSVIFAVSLTALLVGFSFLPGLVGILLIVVGLAGLSAFLWWETRAADALLDVSLFRHSRVFAFSNLACFINYSASSAMIFLMSLYLEDNRRLNAQTAGFVLVTCAFFQALASPLAGRLADRVQARYVASCGMVMCVLGLLGLSFLGAQTPYWYIVVMLFALGLGMGLFSTPNTHAIMGSVEARSVGVTSATIATMRQSGMSISIGVATLVLALEVGRRAIEPADYPGVLTTVRICFLIFAALSAVGVGASLVGPKRGRREVAER
jgi:EmrB/QacA subfamily drug resistance transporter